MGTEHSISSPSEIEFIDDRVVVRYVGPKSITEGGVHLPEETVKQKEEAVQAGEVVAVGPGRFTGDGRHEAMMDIRPGDIAFFPKFQGWQLLIPNPEAGKEDEYRVFGQHDLFGIKKVAPRDEVETLELERELYEQGRHVLSTFAQMMQDEVQREPTEEELEIVERFNLAGKM